MNNIESLFSHYQQRTERMLPELLPKSEVSHRLLQAMQYTLLSGGKRLRPALVYFAGS